MANFNVAITVTDPNAVAAAVRRREVLAKMKRQDAVMYARFEDASKREDPASHVVPAQRSRFASEALIADVLSTAPQMTCLLSRRAPNGVFRATKLPSATAPALSAMQVRASCCRTNVRLCEVVALE